MDAHRHIMRAFSLATVVGLSSMSAAAFEQATSVQGAKLHWVQGPVTGALASGGDKALGLPKGLLARVMDRARVVWTGADCTSLELGAPVPRTPADIRVVVVEDDWTHGDDVGAFTVRTQNENTGALQSARIELNPRMRFSVADAAGTLPENALDLEGVLLHEMGHALGLANSPAADAVMNADARPGAVLPHALGDDDKRAICALYPKDFAWSPRADAQPAMREAKDPEMREKSKARARTMSLVSTLAVFGVIALAVVVSRKRKQKL